MLRRMHLFSTLPHAMVEKIRRKMRHAVCGPPQTAPHRRFGALGLGTARELFV
jgi:hypothetical protein